MPSGRIGRVPTTRYLWEADFFAAIFLPSTSRQWMAPRSESVEARTSAALASLARRVEHRAYDLVVTGASAEIARQMVADLGLGRPRNLVEQRLGRHQEARRADAALQAGVLEEFALQHVQFGALGEPLDGFELAALRFDPQHEARADRAAVDQARTGVRPVRD